MIKRQNLIWEVVRQSPGHVDFPETLSTYQSIGLAAGYGKFEVLMQDREKLNHLVTLSE